MTTINIMAGGPHDDLPTDWQQLPGVWIGVDRGTLHLVEAGIQPDLAVGDFDSLTCEQTLRRSGGTLCLFHPGTHGAVIGGYRTTASGNPGQDRPGRSPGFEYSHG